MYIFNYEILMEKSCSIKKFEIRIFFLIYLGVRKYSRGKGFPKEIILMAEEKKFLLRFSIVLGNRK